MAPRPSSASGSAPGKPKRTIVTIPDTDEEPYTTRSVTRRRSNSLPAPRLQGEGARKMRELMECVLVSPRKAAKRDHPPSRPASPRKKPRSTAVTVPVPSSPSHALRTSAPPTSSRRKGGLLTPSPSSELLRTGAGTSRRTARLKAKSKQVQDEEYRLVKPLPRRRTATTTSKGKGKAKAQDPAANAPSTSHDELQDMDASGMDMGLDLDMVIPDFQMLDISDAAAIVGSPAYLLGADKAYLSSDAAAIVQSMKHALRLETAARRKAEERLLQETRKRVEAERQVEELQKQLRGTGDKAAADAGESFGSAGVLGPLSQTSSPAAERAGGDSGPGSARASKGPEEPDTSRDGSFTFFSGGS